MLKNLTIDKNMAKLILFQRVELLNSFQKKIRKIFGRYLFKNFMIKFFLNIKRIESIYYNRMLEEFNEIKGEIAISNKSILSIGGGLGGLELILSSYFKQANFLIIERNYISKKIIYGWDNNNSEAYNILDLTFKFLTNNGMSQNNFKIYDFDKKRIKCDNIKKNSAKRLGIAFNNHWQRKRKLSKKMTSIKLRMETGGWKPIFKKVVTMKHIIFTFHMKMWQAMLS